MNKLVSLTPENISYIKETADLLGGNHKFSMALNKLIDEHRELKKLNDIKKEILSLKNDRS